MFIYIYIHAEYKPYIYPMHPSFFCVLNTGIKRYCPVVHPKRKTYWVQEQSTNKEGGEDGGKEIKAGEGG